MEFGNHRQPSVRICFQRSWMQTVRERELAPHELETLLVSMSERTEDEYVNAFLVVTSCLQSKTTEARTRAIGLDWLRQQATPASPPLAKHHVLRFALGDHSADGDELLLAVQPIAPEHVGSCNLLIQILSQRLRDGGMEAFRQLLVNMATAGGNGIPERLRFPRHDEHSAVGACGPKLQRLPGGVVVFRKAPVARIGIFLIGKNYPCRRLPPKSWQPKPTSNYS